MSLALDVFGALNPSKVYIYIYIYRASKFHSEPLKIVHQIVAMGQIKLD